MPVVKASSQKLLELNLGAKLTSNNNISEKIYKVMRDVGILCKLKCVLPRSSVLTIYKSFIRPHLDYGDINSDQPATAIFFIKIESVPCNAALAITDAIRDLSHPKSFQELGLEYLHLYSL